MFPHLIETDFITIKTFWVIFSLGFLLFYFYSKREFEARSLSNSYLNQILPGLFIVSLIGSRVFFFLFLSPHEFINRPQSFLQIEDGGYVLSGALTFSFLYLYRVSKKKDIPYLKLTDSFIFPLILFLVMGYLSCLADGRLYGIQTTSPFSLTFTHPASHAPQNIQLLPLQVYFCLWFSILALIFGFQNQFLRKSGYQTSIFFICYGFSDFFLEYWRADFGGVPLLNLNLSLSQSMDIGALFFGFLILNYLLKNKEECTVLPLT